MTDPPMSKSSAQATRDNVVKYKNAGLIQAKIWVHPEEAHGVRLHAAKQPKTKPILEYLKARP
jgi:quinolinate synthase